MTTGAHGQGVRVFLLALIGVPREQTKKRAVDSDSRNSLTKIFYWQCLEIILIGCKLLG